MSTDLFTSVSLIDQAGTVYNLDDEINYLNVGSDGLGMPAFERAIAASPVIDGEKDLGFKLGARVLKLGLKARAATAAAMYARRDELLRLFAPKAQALVLQFVVPGQGTRAIDVFLQSGLDFPTTKRKGFVYDDVITLRAPDPTFYDPVQVLSRSNPPDRATKIPMMVPTIVSAARLNMQVSIPYFGSWQGWPQFAIIGPLADSVITNLRTGEVLDLTGLSLAAGQVILIDCRPWKKTVVDGLGVNKSASMSAASDLGTFHLQAAAGAGASQTNIIKLSGTGYSSATRFEIGFYTRYIGI